MNKEKEEAVKALKISRGQIEATIKMIEEERYCVDVSNQIIAAQSLLKKANLMILRQHMDHCVMEAFQHDNAGEKIDEIIELLSKVIGK
ncbi:metal-sensing transcriptional repressor [Clostridium sp. Marseille-QA1073]